MGTYDLYNVKSSKEGTYFDIHILITDPPEQQQVRALYTLQQWNKKFRGMSHYSTQGFSSTLLDPTCSSKSKKTDKFENPKPVPPPRKETGKRSSAIKDKAGSSPEGAKRANSSAEKSQDVQ